MPFPQRLLRGNSKVGSSLTHRLDSNDRHLLFVSFLSLPITFPAVVSARWGPNKGARRAGGTSEPVLLLSGVNAFEKKRKNTFISQKAENTYENVCWSRLVGL